MSANLQPLIATLYNPHTQSKEALIAGFIARKQKFERIFRDIREAPMIKPEQHYLVQGIRGMGKTTLLLRIAYEIDNTPDLRQRLIPVVFNEEEYGISSLADVWERTAQYLGEADQAFVPLYNAITEQYGQDDYEKKAFETLIEALRQQNKKLILLIDNVGDVLKKLDKQEEKRLREVLLTTSDLRLIGATSVAIEQVHDYTRPFYEFFKVVHLEGLSRQEAIDLFLKLGETYHNNTVKQLIERQLGRIEAIRRLTGGVIRTMVLLFEILVENDSGSFFRDLNVLLDRVTPLYKHRLDDLPAQQQKIVAALAQAWDAASTKELAKAVRLESKVVSAQLKQLIDNNVVEKVETKTKNHLYRLEERFFNIWYLMRFGRKTDQRVLWLMRFFETMFDGDTQWMQERIGGHLQAMEIGNLDPEAALYLTTAFSGIIKDEELEDLLKKKTEIFFLKFGRVDLFNDLSISKYEQVNQLLFTTQYIEAATLLESFKNRNYAVVLDLASCYYLSKDIEKAKALIIEFMLLQPIDNEQALLSPSEKGDDRAVYTKVKILVPLIIVIGIIILLYAIHKNGEVEIDPDNTTYLSNKQKESLGAEISLRYFFLANNSRKQVALKLVDYNLNKNEDLNEEALRALIARNIILLWNNNYDCIEELIPINKSTTLKFERNTKGTDIATLYFYLLLAKKQYHTAYKYFQQEEWQLKDRFKPLYYATLSFLQDEYPTEYLRMGPELKETVDDILAEVAQMAIDYA